MTAPSYIIARSATPTSAPSYYTSAAHYRWTTNERAADRLTLADAAQLRDDLTDHDAMRGTGYAFAVVAQIDTPRGPAHRELTPAELGALRHD